MPDSLLIAANSHSHKISRTSCKSKSLKNCSNTPYRFCLFYLLIILFTISKNDHWFVIKNYRSLHSHILKMAKHNLNRLRVVLAERNITNKWLAEQLGVTPNTVSAWVTNSKQPSLETFYKISMRLKVDIRDLLQPTFPKK